MNREGTHSVATEDQYTFVPGIPEMTTTETHPAAEPQRWYSPTPGHFLLVLLAVEGSLWLSDRLGWPAWHKGYAVLGMSATVVGATLLMLIWFAASRFFRWRFQFSVRSLLTLAVAVAVPCGWWAAEMRTARKQAAAVEAIQERGGRLYYEYQIEDGKYNYWILSGPVPNWIVRWLGEDFFYEVAILNLTVMKPATLSSLEDFDELEQWCRAALRNNPNDVQANLALSGLFLWHPSQRVREEHHDEVHQCAERVLRYSDPNSLEFAHAKKLLAGERWTFEELCAWIGPDGVLR